MVWKKVNNSDAGDATHFGGNDIDKISDLFSGVADIDTVDLNSETRFRNQKFRVRNPANTFSYIMNSSAITANRIVTLPLLTADDTFVFQSHPQTISNKIFTGYNFDSATNVFKGFAQDPLGRRWGCYQPLPTGTTAATVGTLTGMLSGHTPTSPGTASNTWDTTEGLLTNFTTAASAGSLAGLVSPTTSPGLLKITAATMMRVRLKVDNSTNTRVYFGASSDPFQLSDTPIGSSHKGVCLGFSTADTNFSARGNDGSGSATVYSLGVAKNSSFNTLEINWPGQGAVGPVNFLLNGVELAEITATGDLPAELDNLFFHFQIQAGTTSARTVSTKGVWVDTE